MGTPARFDYTVLGDQVNLGARLEALTKEYGVDILVGESTAKAAGAKFVFREVDVVRVKGRAGAAPVYELVGRAGISIDDRFTEALATYRRRDFAAAQTLFAALTEDATAQLMAKRCAELAASPPPTDVGTAFTTSGRSDGDADPVRPRRWREGSRRVGRQARRESRAEPRDERLLSTHAERGEPSFAAWKPALLDALASLEDDAILVGHSIGGRICCMCSPSRRVDSKRSI